jgi:hypothetical protein
MRGLREPQPSNHSQFGHLPVVGSRKAGILKGEVGDFSLTCRNGSLSKSTLVMDRVFGAGGDLDGILSRVLKE